MNTDLEITNNGTDYIRLDEMLAATSSYLPTITLTGDELISLPETHVETPLGNTNRRRPVLTNGGFGVSGLKVEHRLDKVKRLNRQSECHSMKFLLKN